MSKKNINSTVSGFTILEVLVAILMIGTLSAIALPSWLSFIERNRLNSAQNQVYNALRQAQSQATNNKQTWQASFRANPNGAIAWAVHPADVNQFIAPNIRNHNSLWQQFHPNVRIDEAANPKGKKETTINKNLSNQEWRILFNYQGCPVYNPTDQCSKTSLRTLGQLTLNSTVVPNIKRCVYVSTILGALKTGKENEKPNYNGKYCY